MRYLRLVAGAVLVAGPFACGGMESGGASRNTASDARPSAPMVPNRDTLILAAAKVGLPPSDFLVADLPEPNSSRAALLVKYCGQCHAVPAPTTHSATDWPVVVRRMWLRMDQLPDSLGIAVPELGERAGLLEYLNEYALQVSGATLPAGPGREAFSVVCTQCHGLPDPRAHSAADWVVVFMRMERNMSRMGVRPPSRDQLEQILRYLGDFPSARQ